MILAAGALLGGCDGDDRPQPKATGQRSQAVTATGRAALPEPPVSARAPATKPASTRARALCAGELDQPGRDFPTKSISRAQAPGSTPVPAKLEPRGGWTWVNFWAAWCVPCKEEMPRLRAWEKKLRREGARFELVFVSLDDDTRQLDEFLAKEPAAGVRASYWLVEGKERSEWLKAAQIEDDPELPTHLLVDREGNIRCRVKGAVEDRDFDAVAAIVKR